MSNKKISNPYKSIGILKKIILDDSNKQKKHIQKYITRGNPNIQFFKKVYYRFYNFSTQSFSFLSDSKQELDFNIEKKFIFKFKHTGDLLSSMYLLIRLPKIISDDETKLSYVRNVGVAIIKNIDLKIKGQVISRINGENIYISNILSSDTSKNIFNTSRAYNSDINIPDYNTKYSHTTTSKLYNRPIDINDEQLHIPIEFGFSKDPSLYMPLFLYNTDDIVIEVTLRALNEIYTVETHDKDYWYYAKNPNVTGYTIPSSSAQFRNDALSNTNMSYISTFPTFAFKQQTEYINSSSGNGSPYYLQRYESRTVSIPNTSVTAQNIKYKLFSCCDSSDPTISHNFNINCKLESQQIFLDKELKQKFYNIFIYTYLFEHYIQDISSSYIHKTYTEKNELRLNILSPIKNMLLAIQRSDNSLRNEWLNFSNYEDSTLTEKKILKYQDNWWYLANSVTKTATNAIVITSPSSSAEYIITPDNFQEFLFRYGPHGEAGYIYDSSGSGFSQWPDAIKGNESTYTIKEINEFRTTWKYRKASDIPVINTDNFNSTWKQSPLDTMEIKFHSHIREDIKPSIYYNTLQPYNHSTNIFPAGLFMYSFNLNTHNIQPHGSFKLNPRLRFTINLNLNKSQTFNDVENYFTITPYALCYNIIHIKKDSFSLLYYNY